ncbi:CPBP family intramembrane glutamic endopeptidase [Photobacterium alginatilyticum]|uniref:CPBP family intramembrane metalloprotease n=1 Tax=Photobacterium alginatilyticum TaxID=1775171 RepID=A0ABW9YEE2_9GAMM|nr:CPBP family intramembrane glutamic endopeptidase [Photobacterium alginatilyticum]NBI52001.1 CPBP family intramembrane metalloprotease [Photobacterium alginatilyticum]
MFDSSLLFPDALIWLLLACSIVSLFITHRFWPFLLSFVLLLALWLDRLTPIATAIILVGLGIAAFSKRLAGKWRASAHFAVILWGAALALHLTPGFGNLLVLDKVISGPDSIPFTMYLNLDKPLIIFGLYLLVPGMLSQHRDISLSKVAVLVGLFALTPTLAALFRLVRPEFSFPEWIWLFAFNNLLFTCVAEEVLFRGYVQNLLTQRFSHWIGIGVASTLFGLAHFAGGPLFILVAGCAGILYGLTYYWTGRLSLAIGVHFGFNLVHLVFFTYPLGK